MRGRAMTKKIVAAAALILGGVACLPLAFGILTLLIDPPDEMTGLDWGFIEVFALCAAVGGALIATAFWFGRRPSRS